MAEQLQTDFGLNTFILKYSLKVSETNTGRFRKLTLTPTEKTPSHNYTIGNKSVPLYEVCNCGYENPVIDVVLSGNFVLGATLRGRPDESPSLISIRNEQTLGYYLTQDHVFIGVRGEKNDFLDFENFLEFGENPHSFFSRYSLGEQDVHAMYTINRKGEAIPCFFSFGQHNTIRFESFFGFEEGWFQISVDDSRNPPYYVAKKDATDGSIIEVSFPLSISQSKIQDLERLVKSEKWWEMPKHVPILEYSISSQK